jgi:1-acyl-sn-glycerol-3-phosphate acyltransferase
VARLALATGAPVIPVGVSLDPARIFFRDSVIDGVTEHVRWCFRGPYYATVGAPMTLAGDLEDRASVRAATARIMDRIVGLAQHSALRMRSDLEQDNRAALLPGLGRA